MPYLTLEIDLNELRPAEAAALQWFENEKDALIFATTDFELADGDELRLVESFQWGDAWLEVDAHMKFTDIQTLLEEHGVRPSDCAFQKFHIKHSLEEGSFNQVLLIPAFPVLIPEKLKRLKRREEISKPRKLHFAIYRRKSDRQWMLYANVAKDGVKKRISMGIGETKTRMRRYRKIANAICTLLDEEEGTQMMDPPNFDAHVEGKNRLWIGDLYITANATVGKRRVGSDGVYLYRNRKLIRLDGKQWEMEI